MADGPFRSGVRLFSLAGIEIRLDVSVVIIFALIVMSLGSGVFPTWHPDWGAGTVWLTAFVSGLLFFASLLAHELSHALMARRYGIQVPRITLFLFGGMAEIEREGETPSAEFAIAVVGPLMSLAIATGCIVLVGMAAGAETLEHIATDPERGMAGLGPVLTISLWLGSVNFMLAVFNMVPGFPLDGGRVARALVWRLTGDRMRATRVSATAGRWFGWLIMGLGLWDLLVYGSLGGLWLILIGWFLTHLATQSYAQAQAQKMLAPLKVADLMRTRFETVPASLSVARFADDCLLRSNQLLWPVMRGDACVGTVTLDEVLTVRPEDRALRTVADIARPLADSGAITTGMHAEEASRTLAGWQDRPVPVLDRGEVVGLLRYSDILRWMMVHGGEGTLKP